jgi:hypothetical protein
MSDFHALFLKTLLATVPFVTLLLLSFKANLSKPKRSRQFALPFVATIYCVIAVLLTGKINWWITSVISWFEHYVPFIENLNFTKWLNYIFNTAIISVFLIVKIILLPIVSKVWGEAKHLFDQTAGKFYEHNERMNAWVLKDEFVQAKTLWKGFYLFGAGISLLVLALSQLYPDWAFFQTPFYPVFGVLVMGEILFFLSGLTYQEMLTTIAGDDDEYYRVANYGVLRRIYHGLYDNRILFDNTADNLSGLSSFEMLDNLAESENTLDVVISKYFSELKEEGHTIDPGFVRASIDMVNGKSVLLHVPFYRDLTGYIVLPVVRRLLSYEKALVIVGRDSAAEDVRDWMLGGISAFCGTPELWKTDILTEREAVCDMGVLRFADIYNRRILNANAMFLSQVGFVVLVEPSRIASTGQIGLSLIVDELEKNGKEIVYCSCDRNCDGLVDTLSHIFKKNLTEVYATIPTLANCSLMYWNAHGDFLHHKILPNIAHYLGIGTELSSVALQHGISNTVWVGSERFPVVDMRWIAGQYYNAICGYAGYPQNQEKLAEVFQVDANLWNLDVRENAFLSVEDEFNNLFEITRLYSTRAQKQGFVNVISENYLLRDYMVSNAPIFSADPKAIPSIVSDYTRTERNTAVRLVMRMFGGEVSETDLAYQLSIAGIEFADAYKKFCELIQKHCHLDTVNIAPNFKDEIDEDDMSIVKLAYYTIHNDNTKLANYARTLSNAYFIIEDDKDKSYYIGAMLYGQVFQKYLPGQLLTYSGKYYQVQTITQESGVVLRRAADHIADRRSYRQRREYSLSSFILDTAIGSRRTNRGVELTRGFCDISVKTRGYYELTSLDNLAAAHKVDLNNIPERAYKNKAVLYLRMPEVGEDVRFTIATLLNEIFVTVYPETYHYITATIKMQPDTVSNVSKLMSPTQLHGFDDEDAIFIIEDCEIDLGLLVSVERNLVRLLEIISAYLEWHEENPIRTGRFSGDEEEGGFVTQTKPDDASEVDETAEPDNTGSVAGVEEIDSDIVAEARADTGGEDSAAHNCDAPAEDPLYDHPAEVSAATPKKYSEGHFIFFGYELLDSKLNLKGTRDFLAAHVYNENALEQARVKSGIEDDIDFDKPGAQFCDFCAAELSGGEYDVLADGRERCTLCANSALKTVEQYIRLYENAHRNMETFFGIRINVAIKVRMANARKIAKLCGEEFIPTPGYDGRILAFAKQDSDGYTIYVENGAPKIAAVANIVHELTHIWQYINWDRSKIRSHYGAENDPLVYEGMAMWAEIQYLFFLNEVSYAKRQEIHTRNRDDAYGRGFVKFAGQYPLIYGSGYRKISPFNKEWPLELPL